MRRSATPIGTYSLCPGLWSYCLGAQHGKPLLYAGAAYSPPTKYIEGCFMKPNWTGANSAIASGS